MGRPGVGPRITPGGVGQRTERWDGGRDQGREESGPRKRVRAACRQGTGVCGRGVVGSGAAGGGGAGPAAGAGAGSPFCVFLLSLWKVNSYLRVIPPLSVPVRNPASQGVARPRAPRPRGPAGRTASGRAAERPRSEPGSGPRATVRPPGPRARGGPTWSTLPRPPARTPTRARARTVAHTLSLTHTQTHTQTRARPAAPTQ